jgi:hypothetical protein
MSRTGRRRPNEPELVGASDAAEILGVRQPNLRTLSGLPEPYDKIRATTLWRKDEMQAFADARRAAREEREAREAAAREAADEPPVAA